MTRVAIPSWTAAGLLPPLDPALPASTERSPYPVSLSEIVLRYGTSPRRREILGGFLKYRSRLHAVGLVVGFQWLDGSFLENIELIEGRGPNDLDVVTFFRLPAGTSQGQVFAREPAVFPRTGTERQAFKSLYNVDAYLVDLATPSDRLVEMSAYWYSMWSHRRNERWKGYLTVDLDPHEDGTAAAHLATPPAPGGTRGTP